MDENLIISLISETVNAPSVARRKAALILVQALRAGHLNIESSAEKLLATSDVREVGEELRGLIALYQISN